MNSLLYSPALQSILALVGGMLVLLAGVPYFGTRRGAVSICGLLIAIGSLLPAVNAEGLELVAILGVSLTLMFGAALNFDLELDDHQPQYLESMVLPVIAGVGVLTMAIAHNLIELAIGLETLSLSSAVWFGLGRGERALEAGFKYFLLGTATFGLFLFGTALIHLGTGSFAFPSIPLAPGARLLVLAGLGLVAAAVAFKLALAPLHFGALDGYTAAPPGAAGVVMALSKLGAVFALTHIVMAGGSAGFSRVWTVLALVSIWVGVLGSLVQTDLRRLLAYSAAGHAGFLALAFACGRSGVHAGLYYAANYVVAVLLGFAAISGKGSGAISWEDLKRMELSALRAAAFVLSLMSLAGIPPLPGFWAKLAVLGASYSALGLEVTALAALGGVVGVVYYLKPLPDLFAKIRHGRAEVRPITRLVLVVALLIFATFTLRPALAWQIPALAPATASVERQAAAAER